MVSCGASDTDKHHTSFDATHQRILAAAVDTIIPAGNAIGALSIGADKFVQKVIDDCHEETVAKNVRKQLAALEDETTILYKCPFSKCGQQQRQSVLMKRADSKDSNEKDFFHLLKTETIRAFRTSQQVMEGYHGYKVAPGFYNGCAPVELSKNG